MEILKREGVNRLFVVKSPTKEKCRFTVPPTVALLDYISSGILWRIFAKLGYFAGFSLYFINFPVRISEAAVGGAGDIIFHNLGAQ